MYINDSLLDEKLLRDNCVFQILNRSRVHICLNVKCLIYL